MYNILVCSTIYITTFLLFETNIITSFKMEHNIGTIINILSYFGYMSNMVQLLYNHNSIRIKNNILRKILFCIINAVIITVSIYQTISKIINCVSSMCVSDTNSYELLSIIVNCILLTQFLIHLHFDINKCALIDLQNEIINENEIFNFDNYPIFTKVKVILGLFILALSYNIWIPFAITDYKSMYTEQVIIINGIIIFCAISIFRSLFIRQIITFRHLFIYCIGWIGFVIILIAVFYSMTIRAKAYFAITCINLTLGMITIIALIYIMCDNSLNAPAWSGVTVQPPGNLNKQIVKNDENEQFEKLVAHYVEFNGENKDSEEIQFDQIV
jgi:hypothetical protein